MAGNGEGDIYEKLVTQIQSHRALYDPGSKDYHDSALKDNLWQSIATGLDIEGKYGIKNVWLVFRPVKGNMVSTVHFIVTTGVIHGGFSLFKTRQKNHVETDAANGSSVDKDAFLTYFTACGKSVECR